MIDLTCSKCSGRAVAKVFKNERDQLTKLWECQRCFSVWGIPIWDYVARDQKYNPGLAPWKEREPADVTNHSSRPVAIALIVIIVGTALFLRHGF